MKSCHLPTKAQTFPHRLTLQTKQRLTGEDTGPVAIDIIQDHLHLTLARDGDPPIVVDASRPGGAK